MPKWTGRYITINCHKFYEDNGVWGERCWALPHVGWSGKDLLRKGHLSWDWRAGSGWGDCKAKAPRRARTRCTRGTAPFPPVLGPVSAPWRKGQRSAQQGLDTQCPMSEWAAHVLWFQYSPWVLPSPSPEPHYVVERKEASSELPALEYSPLRATCLDHRAGRDPVFPCSHLSSSKEETEDQVQDRLAGTHGSGWGPVPGAFSGPAACLVYLFNMFVSAMAQPVLTLEHFRDEPKNHRKMVCS